jgi:gliding motility-associated-like protein
MSGTYYVTITLNGCTSVPASTTVIINQTPSNPTVTNPVNFCQNATAVPLTATASPGNTLNWYTVSTGGTASATAPTPNTTNIGSTIYYVSQVTATTPGCESGRTPIVVNVYAVPSISGNFTNPTNCLLANGTITITGLTPNNSYTIQYVKNGGNPTTVALTPNANGDIVISNLSAGTYSNITATLNGCTSNQAGPFTLVDPSAPSGLIANNNGPLCSGNTLNLTSSSSITGATYLWTGPGGFTSSLQNPIVTNTTSAMSGLYTVTATINGCVSAPVTTDVLINQTPSSPIVSSPVNYCQNATAIPLTATANPGNTLNWYTVSTGGTPSSAPPMPNTTNIGSTTYYVSQVTGTTPSCESLRSPITVTVVGIPSINVNSSPPSTCTSSDGTITLTGLLPNTSYTVQYTINGATISTPFITNSSGNIIITNLAAGTYSSIIAALSGCPSNSVGPFTLVNPLVPATPIAGSNSPLCEGNTLNLTATTSTSGVTYLWTGPSSFTSTLQNPSISNITTAANGRFYISAKINNCVSLPDSVDVIINNNPKVDLGPDLFLAPGVQQQLTPTIQYGPVAQYLWTPSTNLNCTICPSPTATVFSNISYSLRVTNNFGCVGSDTIAIKVICEKAQIFIPNAFTPDGDGINDILMIRAPGVVSIKYFRIFNRWGELVFEKNNFPANDPSYGWDGRIKGVIGPPDVYVYTADVICENGISFIYKGNVSILK